MPHALRMRQLASNSIISLVSFCIGDDYGKFSIKQLAIVKINWIILSFFVDIHFP